MIVFQTILENFFPPFPPTGLYWKVQWGFSVDFKDKLPTRPEILCGEEGKEKKKEGPGTNSGSLQLAEGGEKEGGQPKFPFPCPSPPLSSVPPSQTFPPARTRAMEEKEERKE